MFNLNLFTELEPRSKQNTELFKTYKLSDIPANKKRVCTLAWNKSGSKLISGSTDSAIRVSDKTSVLTIVDVFIRWNIID